jgi:hypothetical protein
LAELNEPVPGVWLLTSFIELFQLAKQKGAAEFILLNWQNRPDLAE